METKHTPGPWKVGHFNDVRTADGYRSLASVSSSFELPAEANARLIAQAPAMLRACRMALEDLTQTVNYDEGDPQTRATVAALEKVIAAATNP